MSIIGGENVSVVSWKEEAEDIVRVRRRKKGERRVAIRANQLRF